MEKKSNKTAIGIILMTGLVLAILIGIAIGRDKGGDSSFGSQRFNVRRVQSAVATGTVTYLSTTATSTFIADIDGITDYDLNILFNASTTATSRLVWQFEFSNNYAGTCASKNVLCSTTGNGDWFGEDSYSDDDTITTTHGAINRTHLWLPATTTPAINCGTSCFTKNIGTPNVRAKFVRISFSTRGTPGSLWFEIALKEPTSR
ncbi:MAG: hypothetical protein AAB456_04205 [Patescibacteria group bacterium]